MKDIEQINQNAVELQNQVWSDMDLWETNYSKIIQMLNKALTVEPENISTLTNLGAALCDTGKHKEAIKPLKQAISLGSKDKNTYFNLGVAHINSGKEYKSYFVLASKFNKGKNTWEAYLDSHAH